MRNSIPITSRNCCKREKERVVSEIRFCEFVASTPEQRSACYQHVAKNSGSRSRDCMYS
jgi:hypothetical protein